MYNELLSPKSAYKKFEYFWFKEELVDDSLRNYYLKQRMLSQPVFITKISVLISFRNFLIFLVSILRYFSI